MLSIMGTCTQNSLKGLLLRRTRSPTDRHRGKVHYEDAPIAASAGKRGRLHQSEKWLRRREVQPRSRVSGPDSQAPVRPTSFVSKQQLEKPGKRARPAQTQPILDHRLAPRCYSPPRSLSAAAKAKRVPPSHAL